jgi:SAM-dependent methyltransferase
MNYIKYFSNKRILEVGDVLAHYYSANWDILDKYERGKGIINEDIIDFKPSKKYDLIISISTLEHVGFNEEIKDPTKTLKAINNLKKNCLNVGGKCIITMPIGYNPHMDEMLFNRDLKFDEKIFLKRISRKNEWKEVGENQARYSKYGKPFNAANSIVIGIIQK